MAEEISEERHTIQLLRMRLSAMEERMTELEQRQSKSHAALIQKILELETKLDAARSAYMKLVGQMPSTGEQDGNV